nr:hypothetical protein [uncultured Cohaesibacter sp.]
MSDLLEQRSEPVLAPYELFRLIWQMYAESEGKKLYLRSKVPSMEDYTRIRQNLKSAGIIDADKDYKTRAMRVLTVPDKPAENIACLVDPTCYVSHLSAMQRWGLTERNPKNLILTRPPTEQAIKIIKMQLGEALDDMGENPFFIKKIRHPKKVRRRPIKVYETKSYGQWLVNRRDKVRISTIGQTFLDMLQKPELCGGMPHVLDVFDEHAKTYAPKIIEAIDGASSDLVKSRGGYILEERLGITHPVINAWKAFVQKGGSRKLDPTKEFASTFSETWMISLNV